MVGAGMLGQSAIREAMFLATVAHMAVGQTRKYTGEPYIVHPAAVARLVEEVSNISWVAVATAWLHDVVEDTKVPQEYIEQVFGPQVGSGVKALTNVDLSAGNRKARFELNLERIKAAPAWVQTVKVADLIDNTSTIVQHDPQFAPLYLREKKELLERALLNADTTLWNKAMSICKTHLYDLDTKGVAV